MADAYALAAKYDSAVLAEQFIAGRELTCAVLGQGSGATALPLIEIRASPAVPPLSRPTWPNSTTPRPTNRVPVNRACTSSCGR